MDFISPLSFNKLIRFNFKQQSPIRALQDISFSLGKGSILAILGPNGAGKTTLFVRIWSNISYTFTARKLCAFKARMNNGYLSINLSRPDFRSGVAVG